MEYYDLTLGKKRRTLEEFMLPWEGYRDLLFQTQTTPVQHFHLWSSCTHEGAGSPGSHSKCLQTPGFLRYGHQVCDICGESRYRDRWGEIVNKILEERRAVFE